MTLGEILASAAREAGIEANVADDGSRTWAIAGRPFATLDPDDGIATFRLDPVLADAARRTPDTRPSDRGPEWVAFAPLDVDGHAEDRAASWFAAAVRRAGR